MAGNYLLDKVKGPGVGSAHHFFSTYFRSCWGRCVDARIKPSKSHHADLSLAFIGLKRWYVFSQGEEGVSKHISRLITRELAWQGLPPQVFFMSPLSQSTWVKHGYINTFILGCHMNLKRYWFGSVYWLYHLFGTCLKLQVFVVFESLTSTLMSG